MRDGLHITVFLTCGLFQAGTDWIEQTGPPAVAFWMGGPLYPGRCILVYIAYVCRQNYVSQCEAIHTGPSILRREREARHSGLFKPFLVTTSFISQCYFCGWVQRHQLFTSQKEGPRWLGCIPWEFTYDFGVSVSSTLTQSLLEVLKLFTIKWLRCQRQW